MLMRSGGGAGALASFEDDFSALQAGWSGNLSVSGGQAIVTPTLTETFDETFDDWTGTEPDDTPDGWTKGGFSAGVREVTQRNPGEFNADAPGTGAANFFCTSGSVSLSRALLTIPRWYRADYAFETNSGRVATSIGGGGITGLFTHVGDIQTAVFGLARNTSFAMQRGSNPMDVTVDRMTLSRVTEFAAVRDVGFTQGYFEADLTVTTDAGGGLIHYVDDDNYVLLMFLYGGFSGANSGLIKVVGGVPTILANGGSQTLTTNTVRLVRNGNDYSALLDEATLITATAINDAVFEDCTTWGLFSLHEDNRFDNVVAQQVV
jgi:hypothetical protein